jgi:hypothetical protein
VVDYGVKGMLANPSLDGSAGFSVEEQGCPRERTGSALSADELSPILASTPIFLTPTLNPTFMML